MKRSSLLMMLCFLFVCILFYSGQYFFPEKGIVLSSKIKTFQDREYSYWEEREINKNPNYDNLGIFIDINSKLLEVINLDNNQTIKKYIISSGKPETPSPIGNFKIVYKSKWGKGFGTRWMGLNVPWGKYGIHGTNKPSSIGWAASHGCIRMNNREVEELYKIVKVGTPVTIWGGHFGPFGNGFRTLTPGDRGSDVYEVQKRMKVKGYYPLWVDGIYGEGMKRYVIKFRKDNNLPITHDVDYQFYKVLDIELIE